MNQAISIPQRKKGKGKKNISDIALDSVIFYLEMILIYWGGYSNHNLLLIFLGIG